MPLAYHVKACSKLCLGYLVACTSGLRESSLIKNYELRIRNLQTHKLKNLKT